MKIDDPLVLVFAWKDPYQAIDHKAVLKHFYRALDAVGITLEVRKERNLTFHSWRHFFNTFMRGRISDAQLQRLTGHKTQMMTEHYDHQFVEALKPVRLIQEQMFGEDRYSCSTDE